MTPHRLLNLAIVAAMLVALSASYLLDGPTEIEAAQAVAADLDDAIQGARTSTQAAAHATPTTRATAHNEATP